MFCWIIVTEIAIFFYSFRLQAVRTSIYGRPGACYVDIAGDMVNAKVDRSKVRLAEYKIKFKEEKIKCYIFILLLSIILGLCDHLQKCVLLPSSASEHGRPKRHHRRPLRLESSQKTRRHHWQR